ncbi:hypothetical protein QA601_05145 [Chitinispirillales bacterium ANBcel5]|uniref:hypothetical protein n=1 Tax=Cellulosispirillum alkaliphilum TaxID=3039283 RepID=UPI002A51A498|nr:hypothetical protein [Chitinispirillales bacterium ANBcel5]
MTTEYESYDKLAPVLMNETFETLRRPDMPVDVSAHEGYVFVLLLRKDEEELKNIGYDPAITNRIKELVGTFCIAEAKLTAILGDLHEAVKVWREHRAEGYKLRKKVLGALRFACREDKEALEKLQPFPRRPKQEIMILNLHFLSELGKKYKHHLKQINFDMAEINRCKTFGDKLSRLYAKAYSEEGPCKMRVLRNKAFTRMKELMAEARAYVQYLFHDNPEHLRLYSSEYRRKNYRYKKKKSADCSARKKTPPAEPSQGSASATPPVRQSFPNTQKRFSIRRSTKRRVVLGIKRAPEPNQSA